MFKENEPHWFPLRIRNSSITRINRLKECLDAQTEFNLKTYIPTGYTKVNANKMDFAPFLLNYIFVHSTFADLVRVKSNQHLFEPLRFVMHPAYDDNLNAHNEVLYISDKQMEDYMRLTQEANEKVIFLNNTNFICKPSQGVQIIKGPFTGIVGRIKRIGGNRCVVIPIGSEMAVGVMDVPRSFLRYLTEEEAKEMDGYESA